MTSVHNLLKALDADDLNLPAESGDAERTVRLHQWLTLFQIDEFHKVFQNSAHGRLSYLEFCAALKDYNINLTEKEYRTLFKKISAGGDDKCSWDDVVSFLIVGFYEDDPNNQKDKLVSPISESPVSTVSGHRYPINNIAFAQSLNIDPLAGDNGIYLTSSRDGLLRFWKEDFKPIRSVKSNSTQLRFSSTAILALCLMTDIRIACVSTTEREIRFYDITATTFTLRMVILGMVHPVSCISYSYFDDTTSKLLLGDKGGNVFLCEISPENRGPFQNKPRTAMVTVTWQQIVKSGIPRMTAKEFLKVHQNFICQTYYWQKFNIIFCASECYGCTNSSKSGLVAIDVRECTTTLHHVPQGVTSFDLENNGRYIVAGGPDTILRIWDPLAGDKPKTTLSGHLAGIVFVFLQSEDHIVYTLDYNRTIKVWNIEDQILLQTYNGLAVLIPMEQQCCYYYNNHTRDLIVGGRRLIRIKCNPKLQLDTTDGHTHPGIVSVVLYNKLFQNIVTCGFDSLICVWNPWSRKRQTLIKMAHAYLFHGENYPIEITAACFNPKEQLLLTGARDGTLKIWDYNNAACIRNLSIDPFEEVTAVFWLPERILAMGWNMHVSEFADVAGEEYNEPKKWMTFHKDDITCGAMRMGEALVTGSYSGELMFWKLETGQLYKQYDVQNPNAFIRINYGHNEEDAQAEAKLQKGHIQDIRRKTVLNYLRNFPQNANAKEADVSAKDEHSHNFIVTEMQKTVVAMLFLETRPKSPEYGSLLVALGNGMVQVYSHRSRGGFLGEFKAIHEFRDQVTAMKTDAQDKYLFTSTAFGYIKTWLIINYCVPEKDKKEISMPKLRIRFLFLHKDTVGGRAKRAVKQQQEPMLLNSYRAHLQTITSLDYIDKPQILLSGSADSSCRLWTLGGRYLGTLGSPKEFMRITPTAKIDEKAELSLPPDIERAASFTTLKILTGVQTDPLKDLLQKSQEEVPEELLMEEKCVYGQHLTEPLLGKHFKLPPPSSHNPPIILDTSLPYIPVYAHLNVHQPNPVKTTAYKETMKKVRETNFMEYYNSKNK